MNDAIIRKQALRKTLKEYDIPSDFIGKTVTINSICKEKEE